MSTTLLSLPNELICHIVEEFLNNPADVLALLRGSNKRLAPLLIVILNSFAVRKENSVNVTFWAAYHKHSTLMNMMVKKGKGIKIYHPDSRFGNPRHWAFNSYVMRNALGLRVVKGPKDSWNMLRWAISSPPRVRLQRIERVVSSRVVEYGEEVFSWVKWAGLLGSDEAEEDLRDRANSGILDLLLRYLPVERLGRIFDRLHSRDGVPPMLKAAWAGHVRVVELFLKYGVSPDLECESLEYTALHLAACQGNLGMARMLLEYGADIGCHDRRMRTPLHHAVAKEQREMVEFLALEGAPLGGLDQERNTILALAVDTADQTIVEMLILHGADVNQRGHQDCPSYQPLHVAVDRGYTNIFEVLVREGADIQALSESGTPLMIAAMRGHNELLRMLVEAGADPYFKDPSGGTLMHFAAWGGHESTVVTLTEIMGKEWIHTKDHRGNTPMHVAAGRSHIPAVRALYRYGADVNAVRSDGRSPLSTAIKRGSADTVFTLLDLGARAKPMDIKGAMIRRLPDVTRRIIHEVGTKPIPKPASREALQSELMFAAEYGFYSHARLLLRRDGADPTRPDDDGRVPLHCALENCFPRTASVLLHHTAPADVNSVDEKGNTPLHLAIAYGHSCALIRRLLSKGADPNIWNDRGSSPFHLAAASERAIALVPLLAEEAPGIDVNSYDRSGRTALHIILEEAGEKDALYEYMTAREAGV